MGKMNCPQSTYKSGPSDLEGNVGAAWVLQTGVVRQLEKQLMEARKIEKYLAAARNQIKDKDGA